MKRINDIFYSLQGEGYNTGRAAVFVRFAGCNLRCSFCDTEFDTFREMTDEEILADIQNVVSIERGLQTIDGRLLVVLTGGEPTLQVDEAFVDLLHQHGFEVAMESNGTRPAPRNLDWLTVSPKSLQGAKGKEQGARNMRRPDEIKVIFEENTDPNAFLLFFDPCSLPQKTLLYLQPCDTGDPERNRIITNRCIDYIKEHPQWRLSLQTHKLIGFK